jgi:hypothetical protein
MNTHESTFTPGEIVTYLQMCGAEQTQLQRGMNYRLPTGHTVVLMSRRPNAPYSDAVEDEGKTIIYEGHDVPNNAENPIPKLVDQPERSGSGSLTQNGKFFKAANDYKNGSRPAENVLIYEKLNKGIWVFNGVFLLTDAWRQQEHDRSVFKFRLEISDLPIDAPRSSERIDDMQHPRIIPGSVKQEVFKRDKGQCVMCGSRDELHFDHILPYSKGGTSLSPDNVQLLCARHNLEKGARIQ